MLLTPLKLVYVYDRWGANIRQVTFSNIAGFANGDIYWNGRDNRGAEVPEGNYHVRLQLYNCTGTARTDSKWPEFLVQQYQYQYLIFGNYTCTNNFWG